MIVKTKKMILYRKQEHIRREGLIYKHKLNIVLGVIYQPLRRLDGGGAIQAKRRKGAYAFLHFLACYHTNLLTNVFEKRVLEAFN